MTICYINGALLILNRKPLLLHKVAFIKVAFIKVAFIKVALSSIVDLTNQELRFLENIFHSTNVFLPKSSPFLLER